MSLRPPRSLSLASSPFVARLLVGKNLLPLSMLRFKSGLSLFEGRDVPREIKGLRSSVLLSFGCAISHSSVVTSVVVCKCFVYLDTFEQRHLATRDAARTGRSSVAAAAIGKKSSLSQIFYYIPDSYDDRYINNLPIPPTNKHSARTYITSRDVDMIYHRTCSE